MKLIILDRDGVINYDSKDYIKSPLEWQPIPGSLEAIAQLHQAGYTIAVATNQSGIGRGLYSHEGLAKIHETMQEALMAKGGLIDKIFYCPHLPADQCDCRKPKPGLLLQIAEHFQQPLVNVPFIGDALRDVQAARAVGCKPILVKTGYGIKTLQEHFEDIQDVPVFSDLAHAISTLL